MKAKIFKLFLPYYFYMSDLNEALKKISIIEILVVSAISLAITLIGETLLNIEVPTEFIFIVLAIYIIYRLRNAFDDFKKSCRTIFSGMPFKFILLIVVVNIFFSYGMLYGFDLLITYIPGINYLLNGILPSLGGYKSIIVFDLFTTIIISPIAEELIFRGVFLNGIMKFYSPHFAIVVSSLFFGIMHNPGSMISAFVFGMCMAIIYLKTNNILVPIFAHFINNVISEVMFYIDVNNLIFTNIVVIFIFSLLALISLYLLFVSLKTEWKNLGE